MQQMQWEFDKANLLNIICIETHFCETVLDLRDYFKKFFFENENLTDGTVISEKERKKLELNKKEWENSQKVKASIELLRELNKLKKNITILREMHFKLVCEKLSSIILTLSQNPL